MRGDREHARGEQAHRRACPLCRGARSNRGARALAALESRYIRWTPAAEIAEAAEVSAAEVGDHARAFGLDRRRLDHLDAAAARALELALGGDPCGRVALAALDRLRDLTRTDPGPSDGPAVAGPAPEPDSWEASLGISQETVSEGPGPRPVEPIDEED